MATGACTKVHLEVHKVHLEVSQMHKSASGGEPDAQTKVHLEVSQMHNSASGGAQMSHEYGDSGPLSSAQRDLLTHTVEGAREEEGPDTLEISRPQEKSEAHFDRVLR